MRVLARRPHHLLLALLLAPACQEPDTGDDISAGATSTDTSTGGAIEAPHVTFVGRVDTVDLCGVINASVISFRARQVGCEPGPPAPCTLQTEPYREWIGDAATCPGGQTDLDMRVEVPSHGRFEVEARTLTDSGFQSLCFGVGGSVPTVVTAAQVEARAELVVKPTSGPCEG
jgi:hypothetical protein